MTTLVSPEQSGDSNEDSQHVHIDEDGYFCNIDAIREREYPQLQNFTFLDHAGVTLHAKSLVDDFSREMNSSLFGNPHSASASSQRTSRRVDDVRLQVLRFFNASPGDFDVVFVANATAAIKLVADAFRDLDRGFRYSYHVESHTSLVGVREVAAHGSRCFDSDSETEHWLEQLETQHHDPSVTHLFAYPAQSNMTGNRPPLSWCRKIRDAARHADSKVYTLLDAAGMVSTSPLDLSDASATPDFIALSFYKIFGFPDLGALLVRKASAGILRHRKYFGGGTVEMVTTLQQPWHAKKETSLHSHLEDGTLPFHSIIALQSAFSVHARLYGNMRSIARHCDFLARKMRWSLSNLKHGNGSPVCTLYSTQALLQNSTDKGAIIAFNLKDSKGHWIGRSEVEKLATVHGIHLRTGGLCNPGGIATHLQIDVKKMHSNFLAGYRCDDEHDLSDGNPTGVVRVSLGAMSSLQDVNRFVSFVDEFFRDRGPLPKLLPTMKSGSAATFVVESLSVFPIKSCRAFKIPPDVLWEVRETGLAWDREWCLVHQGTSAALSQKRYPKMALLRPSINVERHVLTIEHDFENTSSKHLEIPLDLTTVRGDLTYTSIRESLVCGSILGVQLYTSSAVENFFTEALSVPCTLARFEKGGPERRSTPRHLSGPAKTDQSRLERSILLSNESPILLVSRSSVNSLNESIKAHSKRGISSAVAADSFRGNILVAEELQGGQSESPYVEESWSVLHIGESPCNVFEVLGPCQRCQMVCVDQADAQRRREPFSTLAKTRRRDGKIWFGMHLCIARGHRAGHKRYIKVGDRVQPSIAQELG